VAYHVCRWNVSETLSPQSFVSNVASQLCRSVGGFAEELRRDPQTLKLLSASLASDIAFREAVLKPLTAALSKAKGSAAGVSDVPSGVTAASGAGTSAASPSAAAHSGSVLIVVDSLDESAIGMREGALTGHCISRAQSARLNALSVHPVRTESSLSATAAGSKGGGEGGDVQTEDHMNHSHTAN
jgi:hypothetical protein